MNQGASRKAMARQQFDLARGDLEGHANEVYELYNYYRYKFSTVPAVVLL